MEIRRFLPPEEEYNAAMFREEASRVISGIISGDKVPIVVGGTGLYMKVLVDGIFSAPAKDEDLRAELREEVGVDVVIISLDVDPNESKDQVNAHIEDNGFDWYFAIAPPEFTQSLLSSFGTSVVIAPTTPVILINEDGDARLLRRGVKSASKLQKELEQG